MDKDEELDEIDKKLVEYLKNELKDEDMMTENMKRIAENFIKRVKYEKIIKNVLKLIFIFIMIGIVIYCCYKFL